MHSMHMRCAASTFICRLLNVTPVRAQRAHGSSARFSLGGGPSGPLTLGTTPAATILWATSLNFLFVGAAATPGTEASILTRGGKQVRHFRDVAGTAICLLLKSASWRPHFEQGSGDVCGLGMLSTCPAAAPAAGWTAPTSPVRPLTRGGRHSRHLRRAASTWICRLLKSTPTRPHPEQGSGAVCGFGRLSAAGAEEAAETAGAPDAANGREGACSRGTSGGATVLGLCSVIAAVAPATRGGRHSRHLRRRASTCIWRLLKSTPRRPQPEHGSGAVLGFGRFSEAGIAW
mmetsp:Transcript_12791/g.39529  ORF Transcript_12791/g.39529 Transcript_12791/m.39529 type:complete len:289 (+) Transcript_12791:208-1074(+)